MNRYCYNCDRNVGTMKRRSTGVLITVGLLILLGLILPLWIITLPLMWGLALVVFLVSGGNVCAICGGNNLGDRKPRENTPKPNVIDVQFEEINKE